MGERAVWSDIKHLLARSEVRGWMCLMPLFNLPTGAEDGSVFQGSWEQPWGGFVSESLSGVRLTQILLLVKIHWAASESSDRHIVRLTLAFLCLWGPVAQLRLLSPLLRWGLCSLRGLCLLLIGVGREETSSLVQCEKAIMKECRYKE